MPIRVKLPSQSIFSQLDGPRHKEVAKQITEAAGTVGFLPEKEKAIEWKDYVSMLYTNNQEVLQYWPPQCREVALDFLKSSMEMVKRVVEYPTCPSHQLTIGVGRHSDMGMLTVLLQHGIGGLYVKLDNGDWAEIPPLNRALVINVGDTLQGSNHKHISDQESPCQFSRGPNPSEKIGPLPEVVKRDGVVRYKELLFQDYMNNFFGQPHDGKKSLDFARAD
ncbi:hypothetical protein Bca101_084228 [Brassica carinata]